MRVYVLLLISFAGFSRYLNMAHKIDMKPDQQWFCSIAMAILWTSTMCSTMFILSMTFDRFYSITRPHKAASFNTVKRAKITIVCIISVSILYNVPQLFMTLASVRNCLPYAKGGSALGDIYYWSYNIINFIFPFVSLLIMNSVIINTLRKRSRSNVTEGQGQSLGQSEGKIKNTEKQIIIMLLLVTFGFLILSTPCYAMLMYARYVNIEASPKLFSDYYLFFSVGQKTYYTNFGINFYLYVISGQKFRSDLVNLFRSVCKKDNSPLSHSRSSETVSTYA